jgi:hypothetical protein
MIEQKGGKLNSAAGNSAFCTVKAQEFCLICRALCRVKKILAQRMPKAY